MTCIDENDIQKHYYIYLTTNLINNKQYVGKRMCYCDIQDDQYLGSGKILKLAINKYGSENFQKTILEVCSDAKACNEAEKYWIKYFDAVENDNFYNIACGGDGGNTYAGLDEESLQRISKIKSEKLSGKNNPLYGMIHSEETRRKISKKLIERYQKTGLSSTSGKLGEKNKLSKTIICIETNEVFAGIRDASRKTGIPQPNIVRSLKSDGKYSAGKRENIRLHWKYRKGDG